MNERHVTQVRTLFIFILAFVAPQQGIAQTLTFEATGIVTNIVANPAPTAPLPFAVGQQLTMNFDLDPAALANPSPNGLIIYIDGITHSAVNVGSYFAAASSAGLFIQDRVTCISSGDRFQFTNIFPPFLVGPAVAGLPLTQILLSFEDHTCAALTSNAFPLMPPDPADFSDTHFIRLAFNPLTPGNPIISVVADIIATTDLTGTDLRGYLLNKLVTDVLALNIRNGIINSYDAKLQAVLSAMDDLNSVNYGAAASIMQAFINNIEAQVGKQIHPSDAAPLIGQAKAIIHAIERAAIN